jgi:RND superfamily putative drug exporter
MFAAIGKGVTKVWPLWIVLWVGAAVALWWFGPNWDVIARGGEFGFMPDNMPSRRAEALLDQAFPNRQAGSTIVVVAHRAEEKLTDADRKFVADVVHPDLAKFASKVGEHGVNTQRKSMVLDLRTPEDKNIGVLLVSPDEQAELLMLDLTADFMEMRSFPLVQQVEADLKSWRSNDNRPKGLELSLTGSAVLGRDMLQAEADSAARTRMWTVLLVIILLIVIYQAPLLALVPLITLYVAVEVSLQILAICAQAGWITVFEGLQVYITVITYGPGVDYTLFLAARYKENLQQGLDYRPALSEAVSRVGAAVTASAFTVICGIGTMAFAKFGKFQEAGITIAFSLFVVLVATLTLTPALLLLTRKWAFWPFVRTVASAGTGHPLPTTATSSQRRFWRTIWDDIGAIIERRPGTVWLATCAVMLPLAIFGALYYNHITYGLIEELPDSAPSVVGTRALENHFPAGITGTATVLLRNDKVDFSTAAGIDAVDAVVQNLYDRRESLEIADVRSIADPLGESKVAKKMMRSGTSELVARAHARQEAMAFYVANGKDVKNHVTRIDIVLNQDPFLLAAVTDLNRIEHAIQSALPAELAGNTELHTLGITASVRDMDQIAASDRVQINSFVVLGVFVILLLLLWQFALSVYLMLTVLFSFLTTMGVTYGLFWAFNSSHFNGLDWTVPIFLFVVLVAIGEDYNIFLITRIHEEQERHGEVHGITVALERTGAIITSCGFIMAGTFASLMTGSLARMLQLGFALAFGVLLDTFIVRPILVPAFLVLLAKGTFGEFGKHLVARRAAQRHAT